MRRWLIPIAFVITALLPSIALAAPQVLCTMNRAPRAHCCCPQRTKPPSEAPVVRAQTCCAMTPGAPAPTAGAVDARTSELEIAIAASTAPVAITVAPDAIAALRAPVLVPRATAPPPPSASVILSRNCVLQL